MKQTAVVFDIDGTLSDVAHRERFVRKDPPDWDRFYGVMAADEPVFATQELLKLIQNDNSVSILLITGRPERYRVTTEEWLRDKSSFHPNGYQLFMRRKEDRRPDFEIKAEIYRVAVEPFYNVLFWLEDRDSVVKMVREELGLPCFQVREGNF